MENKLFEMLCDAVGEPEWAEDLMDDIQNYRLDYPCQFVDDIVSWDRDE